jgi:branched-chain amino acid aminotransferase
MNGRSVRWDEAQVHVSAHALHYGTGVFEGIRCYKTKDGPALFRLEEHLARLFASAAVHLIKIPYSPLELETAVCETIRLNGFESCYVRPICYFGSGVLGLNPRNCPVEVVILAWPWAPLLGADSPRTGVRVSVSPWVKFQSRMLPTTAKACGQYLNSILAVREATARGFDEALLLDSEGHIAEASGENLFIVRDRRLYTNDQASSILLGVTRDAVIEIARDLGYTVLIGRLSLDDLMSADEAFLTGTAAELTPVREVDGKSIGTGIRGETTEQLQQVFYAVTSGADPRYRHWLRLVGERQYLARPEARLPAQVVAD